MTYREAVNMCASQDSRLVHLNSDKHIEYVSFQILRPLVDLFSRSTKMLSSQMSTMLSLRPF